MKKKKKGKHQKPSDTKRNQQPIGAENQDDVTPRHRILENVLQHVRNDHRIPSAALLGSGQLNFDGPDLNESDALNSAEEIFD